MSKVDANGYREKSVKDDGLRVLNLCFVLALALAAAIIVYSFASTGQLNISSEGQTIPTLEELTATSQSLYEGISSKVNDFVVWGTNLINSVKI